MMMNQLGSIPVDNRLFALVKDYRKLESEVVKDLELREYNNFRNLKFLEYLKELKTKLKTVSKAPNNFRNLNFLEYLKELKTKLKTVHKAPILFRDNEIYSYLYELKTKLKVREFKEDTEMIDFELLLECIKTDIEILNYITEILNYITEEFSLNVINFINDEFVEYIKKEFKLLNKLLEDFRKQMELHKFLCSDLD